MIVAFFLLGALAAAIVLSWFYLKKPPQDTLHGQPFTEIHVKPNTDVGTSQLAGTPPTDADKAKKGQ